MKLVVTSLASRRNWMIPIFKKAGKENSRNINYIHNNPVEEGFVERPEDYLYSSAKDFSRGKESGDRFINRITFAHMNSRQFQYQNFWCYSAFGVVKRNWNYSFN